MKLLVDANKQLNYNPLIVYFILTRKEYSLYSDRIKKVNQYYGFTRGIFTFKTIFRGEEYCNDLTEDIRDSLNQSNMIMRLVDDVDGNYIYALGKIPLGQDMQIIEMMLEEFLDTACQQNINNLRCQKETCRPEIDDECLEMIDNSISGFKYAINAAFNVVGWSRFINQHTKSYGRRDDYSHMLTFGTKGLTEAEKNDVSDSISTLSKEANSPAAKAALEKIKKFMDVFMQSPDFEESDENAQGTVDINCSEPLIADHKSRIKPSSTPDIKISIVRVKGKKFEYGFEITIDDDSILLYLGSKEALANYMLTLLKQKMGGRMYKDMFKHKLPNLSAYKRDPDVIWLEEVYKKVFANEEESFEKWYPKVREDSCRLISQGKGYVNRAIKEYLIKYPDAIWYCILHDETDPSLYYYIDIPKDHIILPNELECLIVNS